MPTLRHNFQKVTENYWVRAFMLNPLSCDSKLAWAYHHYTSFNAVRQPSNRTAGEQQWVWSKLVLQQTVTADKENRTA